MLDIPTHAGHRDHPAFSEPLTKEDWRAYVSFTAPAPPELPPLSQYLRMGALERENLEERRFDYHSALVIVETPAMLELHRKMRTTARINGMAPAGARRGHIIDGAPTLGKSTIIKTFGRNHELRLRRRHPEHFDVPHRDFTPVVYISVPSGATPKGLSLKFAEYLGLPVRSKASSAEVTDAVLKALRECGTQLVLIDDIHFLDCSQKDGKLANDHLKYLANYCAATFIYAGVEVAASGLFTEGTSKRKTQTAGRFSVLPVQPFGPHLLRKSGRTTKASEARRIEQRDEWISLIWSLESALRLYKHQPGTLAGQWEYLLDRSGGVIASLSALIRTAAVTAIEDGSEAITRRMLDDIETDWTAQIEYESRRKQRTKKASKPKTAAPKAAAI